MTTPDAAHRSYWTLARKGFREGWQSGRYGGRPRRYALLFALLWAANFVAEEADARGHV